MLLTNIRHLFPRPQTILGARLSLSHLSSFRGPPHFVRFDRIEVLDNILAEMKLDRRLIPASALFLAGKAYRHYRQAGGARTGVMPGFFIGAQAAAERVPLLTRDRRRYTTYFPTVTLIAP